MNNDFGKLTERIKSDFPIGYHNFHKDKLFNYQLNRWYSFGYARLEDIELVAKKINDYETWKDEFVKLAEKAEDEKRTINAAFYYRAAEFFTFRDDPDKERLYDKFQELFYKGFKGVERHKIPFKNGFLPAFRVSPAKKSKGTILMHGGFDSYIEEFYLVARYFADHGYEAIGFEGPGQGAALKKYGLILTHKWEEPTKAVLDYFKTNDVTILGFSMGGYWCLRAAAFEPRIKRVIASSVVFDWMQAPSRFIRNVTEWFFRHPTLMRWSISIKMKSDPYHKWVANNWMYITKEDDVMKASQYILSMNNENLHSERIKQDVLILTGEDDNFVPLKMHYLQIKALKNAKSIEDKIFTQEEQASNHCQIGNIGLAIDVILKWVNRKS